MQRREILSLISLSTVVLCILLREPLWGAQESFEAQFHGSIALGCPTDSSVRINILAQNDWDVFLEYGLTPGVYTSTTQTYSMQTGIPLEIEIAGLLPDTQYYYRMQVSRPGQASYLQSPEYRFHTQRWPGSEFTFSVQGDSHPERYRKAFDPELYARTLQTALSDAPDFYIMMGDDFSVDTIKPDVINADLVAQRYTLQRGFLKELSHSTPLYLVNGNHEQAAAYLLDGTANNVAVWAQNARNLYYPQPAPDAFYSGNEEPVEFIGMLENYFAWTWGDALFVAIDPYWSSPVPVDNRYGQDKKQGGGGNKTSNKWELTLGRTQYQWLKKTLEESESRWKFVFAHHVNGTGRGGVDVARLYEWGGENNDGSWGFDKNRPGWELPVHQLMARNGVAIFFQGHDHLFAQQELDGVTYLTTPYPADPSYSSDNAPHFQSGVVLPSSGYVRVRVSGSSVRVEYIRTYLAKDETADKVHGQVAHAFTLTAP